MYSVLVDTSVWISHFKMQDEPLHELLVEDRGVMHPVIVGELAVGSLRDRTKTLHSLDNMAMVTQASHVETRKLIEENGLFAKGLGYVDAMLLASALISESTAIYTKDRRFAEVAHHLGVGFPRV